MKQPFIDFFVKCIPLTILHMISPGYNSQHVFRIVSSVSITDKGKIFKNLSILIFFVNKDILVFPVFGFLFQEECDVKTLDLKTQIFDQLIFLIALLFSFLTAVWKDEVP